MNLVKVLVAVSMMFVMMFVVGCKPTAREDTGDFLLPKGLSDCRIYHLRDGTGISLNVVRCPNSSTSTTTSGKNSQSVVVVSE
jgi:hypothetical protein